MIVVTAIRGSHLSTVDPHLLGAISSLPSVIFYPYPIQSARNPNIGESNCLLPEHLSVIQITKADMLH